MRKIILHAILIPILFFVSSVTSSTWTPNVPNKNTTNNDVAYDQMLANNTFLHDIADELFLYDSGGGVYLPGWDDADPTNIFLNEDKLVTP